MQEQDYSFERLRAELLEKLRDQGYSPITITGYRYQCNSVFKWLGRNGYSHYSMEGGNRYLQDYRAKHGENQYYGTLRTAVCRLNDILKDTWTDVHSDKGKHFCYYRIIRKKAGIDSHCQIKNGRGACLHCFRHTFAVRSFDKNERNGIKASESVPFLSTYLGHDSLYDVFDLIV